MIVAEGRRVLLVTNRAPTTFARRGDHLRISRGAGGVVTALRHLVSVLPVTWIAAAAGEGDLLVAGGQRARGGLLGSGRLTLRLVPMAADLFADFYGEFCNRILWFVQHGLWDVRSDPEPPARVRALFERYMTAQRAFVDVVAREVLRPGHAPVVFAHDYQLYGLPLLLRERRAGVLVSHFAHIPWPAPAVWRTALPDEILARLVRGLLGADVIGFQDPASRRHFAECVALGAPKARAEEEEVVHGARRTLLRVRPVSIDPGALRPRADVKERLRADPRKLIVRVDRSDPMKNVPRGFRAFERMLERHPEWIGKVRFLARVLPSRTVLPEYAREQEETRLLAAAINWRFGEGTVELIEKQDQNRALAELAVADVVLVNSLADGMNLVAKEAAVLNERLALVLSRSVGAYAELADGAIGIDPRDVNGTAEALHRALSMPEAERRQRATLMHEAVLGWTSADWLKAQLADVEEADALRRAARRTRAVTPAAS